MTASARSIAQTLFCVLGGGLLSFTPTGCGSSGAVSPSGTAVGVICIPSGCYSGAVYDHTISIGGTDPQSLAIKVCRNGVCAQTQLSPGATPASYVGRIVGPLSVEISLDSITNRLFVHVFGRPELLTDGDSYELTIENASSQLLRASIPSAVYNRTPKSDSNCTADCVSISFPN